MQDRKDAAIEQLLEVMARLRDRENGCPWDIEQDFATIAPYTIEEAYEVADAITQGDMIELREELGDLLLQVVFHSQMAAEENLFTFEDVARGIVTKMIDRHPHVFGEVDAKTPDGVNANWEKLKAQERARKAERKGHDRQSALDGVASALPALMRAEKLTKRAARVGFDWPDIDQVFDKLSEEIGELRAEMTETPDPDRLEDELGDMLFVMANLARKIGVDPEVALRRANHKFTSRFHFIENELAKDGRSAAESDLAEMDGLWNAAKIQERSK